jgi:glycosyltransferase involved in cell wall biosynthesis
MTSAFDLRDRTQKPKKINQYTRFESFSKIIYLTTTFRSFSYLQCLLRKRDIEIIYFNGIFSLNYFFLPILSLQFSRRRPKIIIAPRGMLQDGALKIRKLKKKAYLFFLKSLPIIKSVHWHATDVQESIDIAKIIGPQSKIIYEKIVIAPDTPETRMGAVTRITKVPGSLKVVTVSLVTEKKNIGLFLSVLQNVPQAISVIYDIYGPIKDPDYWKYCQGLIANVPPNVQVNYCGAIRPEEVKGTLMKYHFFVLPTRGENFGHAIFEALQVGRPVIISDQTPWDIQKYKAGFVFGLDDNSEKIISTFIKDCAALTQDEYNFYASNASDLANDFVQSLELDKRYSQLFSK